ncbi:MAG TPA: CoA ester lyase [Gaiellaceae bacterium]|jgi:citrate lyase beta subunit
MSDIENATSAALFNVRSLLFAPGNDERKLRRALESDADAVVADLEDAVVPAEKAAARDVVASIMRGPRCVVRVNAAGTPYFDDDLALVRTLELDALVLPKATPEAVAALGEQGPPVIAIVETARGVREAHEVASCARVAALVIGAIDLGAELGLEPRADGAEILYARSKVVVDSAAAGVRPPFDIVHPDVHDDAGLEEECRLARSLGFRGKACIHPRQVPIVNRVLGPSEAEVEWARGVVAAFEEAETEGRGVLAVNGEMIDLPVVERARRVLAEAERSTG